MKKVFQSRGSNLVYETLDIYPLDQKIIFSKLGLVGVCMCVCAIYLLRF